MNRLILLFFAIIGLSAQAQTNWIKGHAVWNYEWFIPELSGSLRIETMNDTIIDGHTCQKLKCDKHTKMTTGPNGSFLHTIDTEYQYIYFEQDTVWYRKNNAFLVLYDFTAVQGQVRMLEPGIENQECNDSSYLFIDSVYSGMLNGETATFYETRDSTTNSIQHGGLVNSHFGMMSSGFSPSHSFFPVPGWCSQSPNDGVYYKLLCFEDDSLSYNPGNQDCEYYTYLGLDESQMSGVSVFPNPSAGKIQLVSDFPLRKIRVMSVTGVVLKEIDAALALQEIILSELPCGTYYLDIENERGERVVKTVQLSGI
ncbi:T9SS type A sorting domain-containing protein [Fluviicola sp.]|uniref:T9SS type A sorting domain-containing protein n=1 Tax=Fluviicola sp. TaxID=1917219 RepID=UPI0031E3BCBE